MTDPPSGAARPDPALVERLTEEIVTRGEALRARIDAVAERPVTVVAVTKGHPVEVAVAAVRAGYPDLGENYAQELRDKAPYVEGARWHFVGRLQSNKVRMLAPHVVLWQSVDRESIVREIARRAPGADVLVQVDLAGLPGRGGCERSEVASLVGRAVDSGLVVSGLMGVAPPGGAQLASEGFRWLKGAAEDLDLSVVSMGMSADLEVALAAGATMVRIGTALVGSRPLPHSGHGGTDEPR